MYVTNSSSSEKDVSLSEEIESPPPTKRRRVSRKEQLDSSELDGDARCDSSSSSDSSHDSSSDSSSELEEEVCVTKEKKVVQAKTKV